MDLAQQKKQIKKKKPSFTRQDSHKNKKLSKNWRKPRGLQSKMREKRRGYKSLVSPGYGTPKLLRGSDAEGHRPFFVTSLKQLSGLKKNSTIIVSSSVGAKKKLEIINQAKKNSIIIKNFNSDEFVKKTEQKRLQKKEKQKQAEDKKQKKEKEAKKAEEKAKNKKEQKTELDEEEKKKQEKKEKDKLLIKKDLE